MTEVNPSPPPLVAAGRAPDLNFLGELLASLSRINALHPPVHTCSTGWRFRGIYSGPTSIAYLFLRLSEHFPDLMFKSQSLTDWACAYLELGESYLRTDPRGTLFSSANCGIANEHLCQLALRAVLCDDQSLTEQLCTYSTTLNISEPIPVFGSGGSPWNNPSNDWLDGRAGYLYLLRLQLNHFGSEAIDRVRLVELLKRTVDDMINGIFSASQPWMDTLSPHLGAAGIMGIITQIVLSSMHTELPAARLSPALRTILSYQDESTGNWPTTREGPRFRPVGMEHAKRDRSTYTNQLVQFCHGAPGILTSLYAIRRHFPRIKREIDISIVNAEQCIRQQGFLNTLKAPCLCHSIAGNVLALKPFSQQGQTDEQAQSWLHCMSSKGIEANDVWMKGAGTDDEWAGLWTGEAGRAWVWGLAEKWRRNELKGPEDNMMVWIGYNDL